MTDQSRPLPLPDGWSPLHSVAYLLLGVAIIDGVLDGSEMTRILHLMGGYEGMDEAAGRQAVHLAHTYLVANQSAGRRDGFYSSLSEHAALLANRFGKMVLRSVVDDMIRIAQADGVLADEEVVLIQSAASAWGVYGEA